MAITQNTVSIAGTWTKTDLVNQLEDAFTWLEWHGEAKTGLILGITTFTGGNYLEGPATSREYYDVFAKTTSGVGTGASFEFDIDYGVLVKVFVNRPGYGYTGGEEITIDGADIGRTSGAGDISFKVSVASTVANAVSYAITATNVFELSGTDRNGAVSGTTPYITIKEGDTLKFVNNMSNSNYRMNIVWNCDEQSGTSAGDTSRVANVYGQNASYNGGEMSWTPVSGQTGVYLLRDDNGNDGVAGIGTIIVLPADPADVTLTSFGSTTSFYAKNTTNADYPYGVLRHEIAPNKKFGDTYRGFAFHTSKNIVPHVCSGFSPHRVTEATYTWNANGGFGYGERNAGNQYLDVVRRLKDSDSSLNSSNNYNYSQDGYSDTYRIQTGGNTTQQLDLNIYKSSIDPKFAVLSYNAPTVPSTKLRDNTFETIIFHNFVNTDVWDNDELFLGGWTKIIPLISTNDKHPTLEFRTNIAGEKNHINDAYASKRMAEFGYNSLGYNGVTPYYSSTNCSYFVQAVNSPHAGSGPLYTDHARIYYRNSNDDHDRSWGGLVQTEEGNQYDKVGPLADFNAVLKGIPLNGNLIPIPYYIPDDFVLISFHYNNPNTNISQGDTITISGSEIYTVITGSYNQQDHTRGILFCARTT